MANDSSKPVDLEIKHISAATEEAVSYIHDRKEGLIKSLKTPWTKYNAVSMGGIEWHTIHLIAGMSGSGKTAIVNMLETELCALNPEEHFDVLSFNFEMLARNLVGRKFANELDLTTQDLYSGHVGMHLSDEDYNRVVQSKERIANMNIYYVEQSGTVHQIEQTIKKFARDRSHPSNRGLIVSLDHTILVNGQYGDKEREILVQLMTMFNGLKKLFYRHGIKVSFVVLSQLNREIEKVDRLTNPETQFPKKADIFGGDACWQFSDVVMVSMNPYQLGLNTWGRHHWPTEGLLFWHFLKVREGEPIVAAMKNVLKYSRVEDYVPSTGTQYNLNVDGN